MSQDNIRAVYNGDLEKLKEILSEGDSVQIYTINDLMFANHNEEFRISLIPLILKGEADHPGNFFKYKSLIDFMIKKKGISGVVFGWKNPNFSKYAKKDSAVLQTNLAVPVSKQMSTYLRHLEVRALKERKKEDAFLKQLDEKTKSSDPKVRKAVQIVKRQLVKNYRLLNPKSNER